MSNAKTQSELLKAYEGWDFLLASRYAILLNTIFMTYFLSSAMPCLLLVGALTFIFIFVCDKIVLLRECTTPPKYNADLGLFAIDFCKSAVYLHICFAAWIFGTDVILDSVTTFNWMFQRKENKWVCFESRSVGYHKSAFDAHSWEHNISLEWFYSLSLVCGMHYFWNIFCNIT